MSKCENCRLRKESAKAFDIHWHDEADCPYAHCPVPDFPQTNADRIRQMTDEELAHLLHTAEEHIFAGNLWNYEQWQTWLKAPVEEVQE